MAVEGGEPTGLDVELARAFAREQRRPVVFVPFRWPELAGDLRAGRFDVVMSGVTVRPERSVVGRFTRPIVESGAMVLVADPAVHPDLASLDAPGVRIAVNAGGHLERATQARFGSARVIAVPDNAAVPGMVARGRADAVVSDTLEGPRWLAAHPTLRARLAPFTFDRKAWWLPAESADLARELDDFLARREASGWLDAVRTRELGTDVGGRPAFPLEALVWTLRERLELMPLVAEAKRESGLPIEAAAREVQVVDAALEATRRRAREAGSRPPDEAAVRALFRAQIEAAKAIQRSVLAGPRRALPAFDLGSELRPALIRIGERIAGLSVGLPAGLDAEGLDAEGLDEAAIRAVAGPRLSLPDLPEAERERLVEALVALAKP